MTFWPRFWTRFGVVFGGQKVVLFLIKFWARFGVGFGGQKRALFGGQNRPRFEVVFGPERANLVENPVSIRFNRPFFWHFLLSFAASWQNFCVFDKNTQDAWHIRKKFVFLCVFLGSFWAPFFEIPLYLPSEKVVHGQDKQISPPILQI